MLSHEMSKGRPHGGLVADVMGLGKVVIELAGSGADY